MKVTFTQSGGFAGLIKGAEFDKKSLPAELGEVLEGLVSDTQKGVEQAGTDAARDLQQYEITIEKGRRRVSLSFDDGSVPPTVKGLLTFLKKNARPQPLD